MLENVLISGVASYDVAGQNLGPLKAINFIFGTNGSGKTSISRVISEPTSYPTCMLTWSGGREIERLVYNSDFITRNFNSVMPGIFTLGEESAETLANIETKKEQRNRLQEEIRNCQTTLSGTDGKSGKSGEIESLRSDFESKCWTIKTKHDDVFRYAFEGLRNSKSRFCDKVISEYSGNQSKLCTIDNLKERAQAVFQKGLERQNFLPCPSFEIILGLEADQILGKKVVGKEDVDVAALIKRLGNSDWVKHGRHFLDHSGKQCPFCQQELQSDLTKSFNEYFDETYAADVTAIERLQEGYSAHSDALISQLIAIRNLECTHLDNTVLRADVEHLMHRIEGSKRLIESKRQEPSSVVALESIATIAAAVTALIDAANAKIKKHNRMVDNLGAEKRTLIAEIWRFLIEDSKDMIDACVKTKTNLDKAITGLTAAIKKKEAELANVNAEIKTLERSVTSVQPTVNEINAILKSFGFTGFTLETAGEKDSFYQVVRSDGSDATKTLSEGEKTFITFLYFYHLIRGSATGTGMTSDRVVVFDDPVSSLDSDVLFIVSTLIKRVLEEACKGDRQIKQVFILTHNIYFHKEVSFDPKRDNGCRAHETFWIVKKHNGFSKIYGHNHNPIKTSYELLWLEVKNPNRSNLTIKNTLRRIIENYFKLLGNLDKDEIVALFSGKEQQICGSLFSWVNDGSHAVHDDLYVSADEAVVESYLDVFKRIFEKTNHTGHYYMMMGISPTAEQAPPA